MTSEVEASYAFGDIVIVTFPFTNQAGLKRRPAVVVSSQEHNTLRPDLVLMAITSQVRAVTGLGELLLTDWRGAGLLKPSVVKPNFTSVERSLIAKRLGVLQQTDARALRTVIRTILD